MLRLFTGISLRYWLALIGLLIGLGFAIKYSHTVAEAIGLRSEVKEQKVTIKAQNKHIAVIKQVAKLDEKLQVATQVAVKEAVRKHTVIQHKAERAMDQAVERHAAVPVSAEAAVTLHQEITSINIDSLWEAYCTAQPTTPTCSGEPHA